MGPDLAPAGPRGQHLGVAGERRRQRIAAYGVCRDEAGRLLLVRASPRLTVRGHWFLPGGGVQHGEHPLDSLRREILEESGLTVTLGPLLEVLSDVRGIPDDVSLHTVRIIYEVESWEGTLRPEANGTSDAVAWFTFDEVARMPLAPYVRRVIDLLP